MSELPQVKLSRQQKMTANELRQFPSVELVDEQGEFIGFLIIPSPIGGMTVFSAIKDHAEAAGVRSNYVIPPKVIQAVNEPAPLVADKYAYLEKARRVKQANLAKRKEVSSVLNGAK